MSKNHFQEQIYLQYCIYFKKPQINGRTQSKSMLFKGEPYYEIRIKTGETNCVRPPPLNSFVDV